VPAVKYTERENAKKKEFIIKVIFIIRRITKRKNIFLNYQEKF
jgi:hypothetical protein